MRAHVGTWRVRRTACRLAPFPSQDVGPRGGTTKDEDKACRKIAARLGHAALTHDEAQRLLAEYAAGALDHASSVGVRSHLATGCAECLGTLFRLPVGLPLPAERGSGIVGDDETAPNRRRTTLTVVALAVAVAAFAAWPIVDLQRRESTQRREATTLAARLGELESARLALGGRLEDLGRGLTATEHQAARHARRVRRTAAAGEDLKRALGTAEERLAGLLQMLGEGETHATKPLPTSPSLAVSVPPADPERELAAPVGGASRGGGPCAAFSGAAGAVCTSFCESLDCDATPGPACDRLRARFERLTGNGSLPCDAATVAEDITPCDQMHLDVWTFAVRAGERHSVSADTVDAASAADLCLLGSCQGGSETFFGDDQVGCSFALPGFGCPRTTLAAAADGVCTVAVTLCSSRCSDPSTARYRLTVDGVHALTLVADDAS